MVCAEVCPMSSLVCIAYSGSGLQQQPGAAGQPGSGQMGPAFMGGHFYGNMFYPTVYGPVPAFSQVVYSFLLMCDIQTITSVVSF